MSRPLGLLVMLAAALAGTGCQGTTLPEQREILGSWVSRSFAGAMVRMTVTETARAVEGAGSWITDAGGIAFRVTGAVAEDEVALHFDFEGQDDLNFQGFFSEEDAMEGFLTGGDFQRAPIIFDRDDLLVD